MIDTTSTLEDVCFAVSEALVAHGMDAVLTGGSAAAIYAPQQYTSVDADFVLENDDSLDDVAIGLATIGYTRIGRSRIFSHPASEFTIDFPKGPLAVAGDYVRQTITLTRGEATLRILTRTDCVRDRLAHFYHWDDYTALNAAVWVAAGNPDDVDMEILEGWTQREGSEFSPKLQEFRTRFRTALSER